MKSFVFAVAAAAVLATPLVSFAQVQTNQQPLTRAEVRADLIRVEQAGYRPTVGTDTNYPTDMQAAEARVAQEEAQAGNTGVGGAQSGSTQSGGSAQ
jgi:hypothetical protein